MISTSAAYYDGHSSIRQKVKVEFLESDVVIIHGDGVDARLRLADIRVSPRLANTPRYLYLPGGARCELADNDLIDMVVHRLDSHNANRFLHFLESRYAAAFAALVVTVGIVIAIIEYGIPQLSRHIAFSLPQKIEASLGRDGLGVLDKRLFEPSRIDGATKIRLRRLFESLRPGDAGALDLRLEFRSSERVGANAFALPAGYVVVTDDLIDLAESEEELMAVMAHEIGHVKNRHILRQMLQNSLTALLVAGLLGDLTSITGLSATLPTFLVQQKYSRQFEQEADQYAAEILRARNISVAHLVNILKRLTEKQARASGGIVDYLSSHPATDERIKTLRVD